MEKYTTKARLNKINLLELFDQASVSFYCQVFVYYICHKSNSSQSKASSLFLKENVNEYDFLIFAGGLNA